jgi:hypothetical protein
MQKTEWYPPHIKPVRVGLYETRNRPIDWPEAPSHVYMDWWDGFAFCEVGTGNRLMEWSSAVHWRGLTEEVK